MTVNQLASELGLSVLSMPDGQREIHGAYIGDLLSWVMGRAEADNVWITIMSNINVIAVATLADTSCVILAEGVTLDEQILSTAKQKGVNILSTEASAYEIAIKVSSVI